MIPINPLNSLFNIGSVKTKTTTPSNIPTNTLTLPNGGGTYNPAGDSKITPPITDWSNKLNNQLSMWASSNPANAGSGVGANAGAGSGSGVGANAGAGAGTVDLYSKYRDPNTGNIMSPEEYAIYLGNKVPKGNGQIPNYAGDAMTNPNETSNQLITRATNLNNARNDIATGERDPYGVGNKSGIAYSPAELRAIEKAYAGVYDPALNDVFSRLRDKQAEEAKIAAREERVFATNEAIRQWKATTGTTKSGSGSGSIDSLFNKTQLNTAARNAGVTVDAIRDMDSDLVNYFVSPPTGLDYDENKVSMDKAFKSWFEEIEKGNVTRDEVLELIEASNLTPVVKTFYIDQVPEVAQEEKEGILSRIWKAYKTIKGY